ncbi:condensation domain-containing protein, partial [Sansalvadorimonas verongulae]|uniref:condensation domain-containing protein n=1 Tax=Sansalvadorimonas verongulae TaxID=2172824 RepID=UPI001E289FEB
MSLSSAQWQSLRHSAQQQNLTSNAVLLTAFARTLGHWSQQPAMTLNLTTFQRHPVHPQVDQIIGDFTALSLLALDPDPQASFLTQAAAVQKQLFADLSHRLFSGVEVLRALRQRQPDSDVLMPVVFTSTL